MNNQFLFDNCQNEMQSDLKIYERRKSWNTIFIAKTPQSKGTVPKKNTEKEKCQEFLKIL